MYEVAYFISGVLMATSIGHNAKACICISCVHPHLRTLTPGWLLILIDRSHPIDFFIFLSTGPQM